MNLNTDSFENFSKLKNLCKNLLQDHKNVSCIRELNVTVNNSPQTLIKVIQPTILSAFYPILKCVSENKLSFRDDEKQLIVDTLKTLFDNSNIDKLGLFFNIYSFLLFEIYDHIEHKVLPIDEEYKLSIMKCMTLLAKCVSSELIFNLYTKENAPKLCQMLYVAIELAKNERLRSLRISAVECIMSIARVLDNNNFDDEMQNQVAETFLFFLPGVASGLHKVALDDEKVGHKIIVIALSAWGKIVTLLMRDCNASDDKIDIIQFRNAFKKNYLRSDEKKMKFKDNSEIKEYLQTTKRTVQWYNDADKRLQPLVINFSKLTHHSHPKVRLELANMCDLIIQHCFKTMPGCVSHLIEVIITLSEDEDDETKQKSNQILNNLSDNLSSDTFKSLLESLEEGFYNGINCLPRKFNGIDTKEQLAAVKLITGYINLFGKHKLNQVLISMTHLEKFMYTLIHISELEKSSINLLEEYTIPELENASCQKEPWKIFRHFKEDSIKNKLEKLCLLLAKYGAFRIISDFLLDIILYQSNHRKEAIFILNETIAGVDFVDENKEVIKNILNTYTDNSYWQIPLSVTMDKFGYVNTLAEVQNNVIQACLLVEGVGKIALVLHQHFRDFLLKTLYIVLERAGSSHPLIKAAGLTALKNITCACSYSSITSLMNDNIDYFTYYVARKLNRIEQNEDALDVLSVVLVYSTVEVLPYIGDIIQEILIQSCDKYKQKNATSFLQVFKIFVQCICKWFNVSPKIEPFKSKKQKMQEIEHFQVTGVNPEIESFSDDIMGKSAEEMYKEDMEKMQKEPRKEIEEPQVEEYKTPDPPLHIKLIVAILGRSIHFLPSKDRNKKLLVLAILTEGVEILCDWENELLPIVHQIWSPLVQRFQEFDDPLIINYSFQLLNTLARLSKEFIRMRTTKEILPSIFQVLNKFSEESHLKDKGAAYRYSQSYKLQLIILQNLARILIDLDVQEDKLNEAMDSLFKYLSERQPIPLQTAAVGFFKDLATYDLQLVKVKVEIWQKEHNKYEYEKHIKQLWAILSEIS